MSSYLSISNFKWTDLNEFDINSYSDDSKKKFGINSEVF